MFFFCFSFFLSCILAYTDHIVPTAATNAGSHSEPSHHNKNHEKCHWQRQFFLKQANATMGPNGSMGMLERKPFDKQKKATSSYQGRLSETENIDEESNVHKRQEGRRVTRGMGGDLELPVLLNGLDGPLKLLTKRLREELLDGNIVLFAEDNSEARINIVLTRIISW